MPSAIDQGLGLLIWSPLAGGLLSGKYRRGEDAPAGLAPRGEWGEPPVYDEDKLYDTIEVLVEVAEGTRRLAGAGRARLAARATRGHERDRRRAHRGAARRQPRRGDARALGRGDTRGSRRSAGRR